jgi:hypothetical protein
MENDPSIQGHDRTLVYKQANLNQRLSTLRLHLSYIRETTRGDRLLGSNEFVNVN